MTEEGKEIISAVKEMILDLRQEVNERMSSLESGQQEMKTEISKIKTTLENETNRNITLLVDGHIQNADKLDRLQLLLEDVEYIKLKTDVIEAVTKVHSYDINYLKKAR